MDEPRRPEEPKAPAGQDFVKKIGPAGCALFLILAVLVAAICLTAGRDPIPGYEPPHDDVYWAAHPQELAAELTQTVLPALDAPAAAEVSGSIVAVTVKSEDFVVTRGAILRYFGEELFEFKRGDVS